MANPKTFPEWCEFYRSLGWKIIPVKVWWDEKTQKNKKQPLEKWENADIARYYTQEGISVGLLTGHKSGVITIDCDRVGDINEEENCKKLDEKTKTFVKKLEETGTKKFNTVSGNYQYIFKLPPDKNLIIDNRADIYNTKTRGYQIDIRGGGGYSVIPPSIGYTWANSNKISILPDCIFKEIQEPVITQVPRSQVTTLPKEGESRHDWFQKECMSMLAKRWVADKVKAHLMGINVGLPEPLDEEDLSSFLDRHINHHLRNENRKLFDNGQAPTSWYVDAILNTPKSVEPEFTTGMEELDHKVWGYQRGRFNVIAGVSNSGKSLLIHNSILGNVKKGKKCVLFTPETAGKFVVQRLCIMETGIESIKFVTNDFTQDELIKINEFKNQLYLNNLIVYEETPTIEYIINQVKLNKPDILYIDYFSMIAFTSYSHWEIKEGVELLHNLARSQNIVVVCAEQLGDVYMSFYDQEKKQSRRIRVDSHDGDVRTSKVLKYTANLFFSLNHYENHDTHQTLLKLTTNKNKITPYMPIIYMELDKNHLKYNIITEERFLAIKGI